MISRTLLAVVAMQAFGLAQTAPVIEPTTLGAAPNASQIAGKLIVTISQNSIGNAITELLGVVVKREPDADAYARAEPALIERLLEVRRRLVEADLGTGIATPSWPTA